MTLLERLKIRIPVLRIPQSCEGAGRSFACEIGLRGCWCSHVIVSERTREVLRAKYRRCLCRACLDKGEIENAGR